MSNFVVHLKGVLPSGKKLGHGSYGEVIEVEWCGTRCAAKRIHDIFLEDISQLEMDKMVSEFEKECQTWASLRHPNIVQLLGNCYPADSRVPMCVMEKMDTSLRHYLEGHSREEFLLPDKVSILRQVAQGLYYLHSQNPPLVHHDLSPNNILLNEWTFQTKLTDFGMTRAISLSKLTRKSSVKGTFVFMPPEALSYPPRYTEKLDVFSFGNCMITTLTHEWPNPQNSKVYEGDKLIALTECQRRESQIEKIADKEKDLFLLLIKRCLHDRPEERPKSSDLMSEMKKIESASDLGETRQHQLQANSEKIGDFRDEMEAYKDVVRNLKDVNDLLNCQLKQKEEQLKQYQESIKQKEEQLKQYQESIKQKEEQLKQYQESDKETEACKIPDSLDLSEDGVNCEANIIIKARKAPPHYSPDPTNAIGKQLRLWSNVGCCQKTIKKSLSQGFHLLAISKDGKLAATDEKVTQNVYLFDKDLNKMTAVKLAKESPNYKFSGITFTSNDIIAVSYEEIQRVCLCSLRGTVLETIQIRGSPSYLASDQEYRLFVCESDRNCISVYNLANFTCLFEVGSNGKSKEHFQSPTDIAFSNGRLYVCDGRNSKVQIFTVKTSECMYLMEIKCKRPPLYLCVSSDDHLFIQENNNITLVYKISVTEAIKSCTRVNKWKFEGQSNLSGIAVNEDGELFIADGKSGIHMF